MRYRSRAGYTRVEIYDDSEAGEKNIRNVVTFRM